MYWKHKFIVMEHERGLLFHNGRLVETLSPGKHVRWGEEYTLQQYDTRWAQLLVSNQEITCADGITLKTSAKLDYRIVDPEKAYRSAASIYQFLYEAVHEALRDVLGTLSVDEAMSNRADHSAKMTEAVRARALECGIEASCAIRDIGVSGEIKRAFGQLVVAQKEAQATLERARAETAALRSLANAAKLMDANPNLLQLRWIHALDQTKGATIVLSPSGMIPPQTTAPTEQ